MDSALFQADEDRRPAVDAFGFDATVDFELDEPNLDQCRDQRFLAVENVQPRRTSHDQYDSLNDD